jgi:hypothetical protein
MVLNQQILLKQFFLQRAFKHHLDGGIRKGALTQEQLAAWLEAKSVDAKKDGLSAS